MTITSSLRFLYILGGCGLLCATKIETWLFQYFSSSRVAQGHRYKRHPIAFAMHCGVKIYSTEIWLSCYSMYTKTGT